MIWSSFPRLCSSLGSRAFKRAVLNSGPLPYARGYSATYLGTFLVIILWGGVGSCCWLVAGGQGWCSTPSSAQDGPASENDVAPHVHGAQTERNCFTPGDHRAGVSSLEKQQEKETTRARGLGPLLSFHHTHGSAAHVGTAQLLASTPSFGLVCPPLEGQEARRQVAPPQQGNRREARRGS